jgi:ABC-type Mn2+/Zn2+ transport system ATPase subunit
MSWSLSLHTRHPVSGVDVTLHAKSGEVTGIYGASGRGKSTLLCQIWSSRPIAPPGKLILRRGTEEIDVTALGVAQLSHLRRHVMAYVGQTPFVLKRDILATWFDTDAPHLVPHLAAFDLNPQLLSRRAGEVSGGELQRFLLLRAILSESTILLLDEPFTGLDHDRAKLVSQILSSKAQAGRLIILTAHQTEGVCNHWINV